MSCRGWARNGAGWALRRPAPARATRRCRAVDRPTTHPRARRGHRLLVVRATHPQADAPLDAARRAAGLDNARLVRILDVGRSDSSAFVVEEDLASAQTLASLARAAAACPPRRSGGSPVTPPPAWRRARLRGLHHERLTPTSVLRTADGTSQGPRPGDRGGAGRPRRVDPETASRRDAVGVVALAYAGLTSRWPLTSDSGGLRARAPLRGRCRRALGDRGGRAPGPRRASAARPSSTTMAPPRPVTSPARSRRGRTSRSAASGPVTTPRNRTVARRHGPRSRTPVLPGAARSGRRRRRPSPSGCPCWTPRRRPAPSTRPTWSTPMRRRTPAPSRCPPSPAQPVRSVVTTRHTTNPRTPQPNPAMVTRPVAPTPHCPPASSPPTPRPSDAGAGASVAAALGSATGAAGQAVGAVPPSRGLAARQGPCPGRRAAKVAAAEWTEQHRVPLADHPRGRLSTPPTRGTAPLPVLPAIDPDAVEPLTRNESKLALGIVAGLPHPGPGGRHLRRAPHGQGRQPEPRRGLPADHLVGARRRRPPRPRRVRPPRPPRQPPAARSRSPATTGFDPVGDRRGNGEAPPGHRRQGRHLDLELGGLRSAPTSAASRRASA